MSRSETAKRWQQRLRRFASSQMTVSQFCQSEGVSEPSFYQWKKKLQSSKVPGINNELSNLCTEVKRRFLGFRDSAFLLRTRRQPLLWRDSDHVFPLLDSAVEASARATARSHRNHLETKLKGKTTKVVTV